MEQAQTTEQGGYLIPLPWMILVVIVLSVGEVVSGTAPLFIPAMAGCLLICGMTYNLLGGLKTFGGILFATFALRTVVTSQIVKVVLGEAADKHMEMPLLAIYIYLVFYGSVLCGAYFWKHINLRIPGPFELKSLPHLKMLYWMMAVAGFVGYFVTAMVEGMPNMPRGLAMVGQVTQALAMLAFILALDIAIRESNGQHSMSWRIFLPASTFVLQVLTSGQRGRGAMLLLGYLMTCVMRGYHFRMKHYVAMSVGAVLFVVWVNPVCIYLKMAYNGKTYPERLQMVGHVLQTPFAQMKAEGASMIADMDRENPEAYFDDPKLAVLSRLSMIRVDSNLFHACAQGYHYGAQTLLIDLALQTPYFMNKNKALHMKDASYVMGPLTGIDTDPGEGSAEIATSPIADAFGSFGWMGIVVFGLVAFPFFLWMGTRVYETDRPWGTVAAAWMLAGTGEGSMGGYMFGMMRGWAMMMVMSLIFYWLIRYIPTRGA